MIAIIGGGVCGLAIGWRLAERGLDVTIFERKKGGMESTWAAAGMLAPQAEAEHAEEALLPLALESLKMWKCFAEDLYKTTGVDVDYRGHGTLVVALDRDDLEHLQHRFQYFKTLGLNVEWLNGYEARKREPHLSASVTGAIFSSLDHQVDSRKVVKALKKAFIKCGGVLKENTEVIKLSLIHI